jgi:hypothetical protein
MAHPDFSVNVAEETRANKNIWTRVDSAWNTKNNKKYSGSLETGHRAHWRFYVAAVGS